MFNQIRLKSLYFGIAIVLGYALSSALAQSYTVTDLGTLPGTTRCAAYDVNDAGQVVGFCYNPTQPFLWFQGELVALPTLGGTGAIAFGVNTAGDVVGVSQTRGDREARAVIWTSDELVDLGVLPGGSYSIGFAINDDMNVAGVADTTKGDEHAFLWQPENGMIDLGILGDAPGDSIANGINNSDQIVGQSITLDGTVHGFLWEAGEMLDLGTLGGEASVANDINDAGHIVGWAIAIDNGFSFQRAFLWADNMMQDLGTLGTWSIAVGNNNNGEVVGVSKTSDGYAHGFIWQDGVMTDLNDLTASDSGWRVTIGNAIDDAGRIAGVETNELGVIRAVLLTPVDQCIDDDGDGRVTGCHIPPGNPGNSRTISVSVNAVHAHLAHGDSCGPCEDGDG